MTAVKYISVTELNIILGANVAEDHGDQRKMGTTNLETMRTSLVVYCNGTRVSGLVFANPVRLFRLAEQRGVELTIQCPDANGFGKYYRSAAQMVSLGDFAAMSAAADKSESSVVS